MRFRSRSSMLVAVPVLLLVAAPVALNAQSGQAPIVMSSGELVEGGTAFELTVRNNTRLAVTAWGVDAEFTYDDGKSRGGTWGGEGVYSIRGRRTGRVRTASDSTPHYDTSEVPHRRHERLPRSSPDQREPQLRDIRRRNRGRFRIPHRKDV